MQFSITDTTALKANIGNPLHFTPTTNAVLFSKPHDISDISTDGDRFYILDSIYYLKTHDNLQLYNI